MVPPAKRARPRRGKRVQARSVPFPHIPGTGVGSTAAEGAIAFAGLAILRPILVGFGLYLLAEAATRFLRKAKNGAAKSDLASRKALHVLHDHARHRAPTAEMLARCRTMTALHAVVCDGLGLVRVRRRTRKIKI